MSYAGLIAAAGDSTRMGFPKALLSVDNTTFVEMLARSFLQAQLEPVIVTVPSNSVGDDIRRLLAHYPVQCMENAYPKLGYMGSIRTAISTLNDVDGIIISPVDCPFSSSDITTLLIEQLQRGASIAVPTYNSLHGHPVGISRRCFQELSTVTTGLQDFMTTHQNDVVEIPYNDDRILDNLNSPLDLVKSIS